MCQRLLPHNGLRTKLPNLKESIPACSYNVIILTETSLSSDISDAELGLNAFSIYRRDRSESTSEKKAGGGVLIAVKHDLVSSKLSTSINN